MVESDDAVIRYYVFIHAN